MKFALCCLGCKVNTVEAQSISTQMKQVGFSEVDFKEVADVYIIFTCAVTNTAASKSRQKINQAIRQNPDAVCCVVGCYVQLNAQELSKNDNIDILVGSSSKALIVDLINKAMQNKKQTLMIEDVRTDAEFENLSLQSFEHQTRAYLKVQDGCNQFCSYCIIPYARGKERSMPLVDVVEQAKILAMHHKEIVLAGIHTGRYGWDQNTTLTQLIQAILNETTIERIRISSIEITEISDELITLIQNNKRIARHLHIPVQSGCDATLKRMNRPYTTEEFKQRVKLIREKIKDISISTDLIVGFQSETDEEFEKTKQFLYDLNFSFIHVFPYSMKDGTVACKMEGTNSGSIKKARVSECLEISKQLEISYVSKFVNKKMDVLIETCKNGVSMGHTSEYIPVLIEEVLDVNSLVTIEGSYMMNNQLYGKVVVG